MNQKTKLGFIVAYVDDIEKSKRFYTEVLGLEVRRESPTFIQFDTFSIATDPSMDGRKQLEVYWLVEDAEAAYRELREKAPICKELEKLPFGKVFGVRDPSGQPRYLLQLAADRPSKAV